LPIARVIRSVIPSVIPSVIANVIVRVIARVASLTGCDYHLRMIPTTFTRFARRAASRCRGTRQ